jgi:hypothetical protein
MKTKIVVIFVCILLIATTIPVLGTMSDAIRENNFVTGDPLNGGWIEEYDDFTILHLNGSYYEMGYQHGSLLGEEIEQNFRAFLNFTEPGGWDYEFYVWLWSQLEDYVPQKYKDEMQGMADGSGMSVMNISIGNIMAEWFHCCVAAAWGPATSDGKLIYIRSFDWPNEMIDPVTGKHLRENQILMVRDPDDGYASLEPSFSGVIGGSGGINENGIGIGTLVSYSWDEINSTHAQGNPFIFRIKMVLDEALNADEAVAIMNSNTTCGWNFIISDKDIGYAVEQNLKISYYGTWDDPVESTPPFWSMDHVVRRTNLFIDPDLAASQRENYHPGIFPLLWMILKLNPLRYPDVPASVPWMHYRTLSQEIEKLWGNIELNNSMDMLRDIYLGKTDFRFFIVQRIMGTYVALHQWVACPETGDILISYATVDKDAYDNPVHSFNLFELLNYEPPP